MSKEKDRKIAAARAAADTAGHQQQDGTAATALRIMSDVRQAQSDLGRELTTPDDQPYQNG